MNSYKIENIDNTNFNVDIKYFDNKESLKKYNKIKDENIKGITLKDEYEDSDNKINGRYLYIKITEKENKDNFKEYKIKSINLPNLILIQNTISQNICSANKIDSSVRLGSFIIIFIVFISGLYNFIICKLKSSN